MKKIGAVHSFCKKSGLARRPFLEFCLKRHGTFFKDVCKSLSTVRTLQIWTSIVISDNFTEAPHISAIKRMVFMQSFCRSSVCNFSECTHPIFNRFAAISFLAGCLPICLRFECCYCFLRGVKAQKRITIPSRFGYV